MKGKILFALIYAAAAMAVAAQTRYVVTDTGADFQPSAINSGCMVTGIGATASYAWDPVNGLVVIPGLPGSYYSTTYDVNDTGTVCGLDPTFGEAILWDRVNGTRLLADFGQHASYAYGINNLGHVVGQYITNISNPFIWKPGPGWTTLYDPGVSAAGLRVNIHDQVLGTVTVVQNQYPVAVIWQPDGSLTYLGNMLNQTENEPYGINDSGSVCGISFGPLGQVAYYRDPSGNYTPLYNQFNSSSFSFATRMNNHDVVAGSMDSPLGRSGYIWSQQSGFTIIDDALAQGSTQWHIEKCLSINDSGQIGALAILNGASCGKAAYFSRRSLRTWSSPIRIPYTGTLVGGVLYCLQFQDALYLAVHAGKTITAAEPPVQVQVSGTSPTASPKSFQFTFTGHVNTPHLTEGILLYNFQTGTYELLNAQAATLNDSTVTVTPTGDLSRFVNPSTKEVRARVTFIPNGQIVFAAWTASLGLTDWTVT